MARLAVGVVGDHVEEGDPHPGLSAAPVLAQEMAAVSVDEELHCADAVRRFPPHHRRRDSRPAEDLAQLVGGHLALVEGARLEVPQRRLSTRGLVDGAESVRALRSEVREEGVVGGAVQHTEDLEVGEIPEVALALLRRWDGHRS